MTAPVSQVLSEAADLYRIRPFCDWHEGHGDVLWWHWPIYESPYVGSPLDLGRNMTVEICIGFEQHEFPVKNTGGWPYEPEDEPRLWWTPLPDARVIIEQVPL